MSTTLDNRQILALAAALDRLLARQEFQLELAEQQRYGRRRRKRGADESTDNRTEESGE